jgi:enoyl-CoA hydratase
MSDVLASIEGRAARLTLNRPAALNALMLAMVRLIDEALTAWERDPAVALVILDGAGDRGFCAGGDIRSLYNAARAGAWSDLATFFREEYTLNARIARYPKPIVAVMDGVTMGGGIGLGAHASHRVVTERSKLALPETRIGFLPDVGGSYLLARAPGETGTSMALTGASIGPADAIAMGFADCLVPVDRLAALKSRLAAGADPTQELAAMAEPPGEGELSAARGWIDNCFAGNDAEAIVAALRRCAEPAAHAAADTIEANSPTSVKVTLAALRGARDLESLEACLDQEFHLSVSITRDPDFVEGVRAAIVDKDRNPAWNPARLAAVTPGDVRRHFSVEGLEDLGLSARPSGRT